MFSEKIKCVTIIMESHGVRDVLDRDHLITAQMHVVVTKIQSDQIMLITQPQMNAMILSTAKWLLLWSFADAQPTTEMPPNVVVFIVDDLGWNQVGYHAKPSGNDEIQTPHIDHYATEVGIELDRGYMTPWCGPSRAATMTGRTNVYNFNVSSLISTFDDDIGYVAGLQPGTKTLATALKDYGRSINVTYSTWFNGKYGIGVRRCDAVQAHS